MRRSFLTTMLAIAAPCIVAGSLPGCATNDSLLFIEGVSVRKAGACAAKADFSAPMLSKGVMDRLFTSEYVGVLLIGNQIMQRGSRERVRTETSRVALKGAEVKIETPQGAELVPTFSSIATGFVDASDGSGAAAATMSATLIPASVSPLLPRGTAVVKIRVFGTTLGGEDVESSELLFPIEVCDGCLVDFPASARDPAATGDDYVCKKAADDMQAAPADAADGPCTTGIDFGMPCTVCSGVYKACQSPAFNCYYTASACQ